MAKLQAVNKKNGTNYFVYIPEDIIKQLGVEKGINAELFVLDKKLVISFGKTSSVQQNG